MNQIIISILSKFRFLFKNSNINFDQLLLILGLKLTLDNRRSRVNFKGQEVKDSSNAFFWTLVITFLMSCFIALLIVYVPVIEVAFAIVTAYTLVAITMVLITDFSSVMLDTSDLIVIFSRPVSSKTLFMSRLIHTFVYLIQLALAIVLPSVIVTVFKFGLLPAFYFLTFSILIIVLAVLMSNIFYLLVMQFSSEEKLRNIINGVQILLMIILMGGYRFVGNFGNIELLSNPEFFKFSSWHFAIPPFWLGYLMKSIIVREIDTNTMIFSLLMIAVPIITFFIITSNIVNKFASKLSNIDVNKKSLELYKKKKGIVEWIGQKIFKNPISRASFEFIWKITASDRKFKLRTYPTMAYLLIIIPSMFSLKGISDIDNILENARSNPSGLFFAIYISTIILGIIRQNVVYYDQPKASWIYRTAPIVVPRNVFYGEFIAIIVKFLLPLFLILSIFVYSIWGLNYLDDVLFGMFFTITFQALTFLISKNTLPFSVEFVKQNSGQIIIVFVQMLLVGGVGFIHYILSNVDYSISFLLFLEIIVAYLLVREINKLTWDSVKN